MFKFLIFAIGLFVFPAMSTASPLNNWKVSCNADKNSVSKKGQTWTFRTGPNRCTGGTYKQRAEIKTGEISPTHKGAYKFSTTISMTSPSNDKFDVLQLHDGRKGCAPPLKVQVLPDNRLSLEGEYKIGSGPGENCVTVKSLRGQSSSARITRDGRPHQLDVILAFDGQGGFRVWVALDGKSELSGTYHYQEGRNFFRSQHFYFKHGVYSKNQFPYEMVSKGMTVKKVRVGS